MLLAIRAAHFTSVLHGALADRIYVMQEGRIVEQGAHSGLLELDGHYAQLFRAQAAGYVQTL